MNDVNGSTGMNLDKNPRALAAAPGTVPVRRIAYHPAQWRRLAFRDAVTDFLSGSDDPRAYLERCLETIAECEPVVQAFVVTNIEGARRAADESAKRYREGRPLSAVDGMPVGIKDLYETVDMPTQANSPVYAGWQSGRDAAHVYALRRGGALILGKTTTTEFGMADPPPTRNPFDSERTAGGSSSGTAAAVGAGMLPVASGSQARGSIVRPAGYCANYALKPTYGAINKGGGLGMSPSHGVLGFHAATLRDMWETAFYVAQTIGGDPNCPGLYGEAALPQAARPDAVVRLDTLGWDVTEPAAKAAFDSYMHDLGRQVRVITRRDNALIEELEQALRGIPAVMFPMLSYDMRWPAWPYRDAGRERLSPTLLSYLEKFENIGPDDYRRALDQRARLRALFSQVQNISPVCVALCQPGIAPVGMGIGDPVYGDVSSVLGTPAIVLPVMAIEEMPLAVQVMGQAHMDYPLCAAARWMADWALRRAAG